MLANPNIYVVSSTMIMPLDDREDTIFKVNQKNQDTVTRILFSNQNENSMQTTNKQQKMTTVHTFAALVFVISVDYFNWYQKIQ